MILLQLFWNFLVIGAVSFGGGYGMISLVRETVLGHGWLTESEFLSFIAVSESTPVLRRRGWQAPLWQRWGWCCPLLSSFCSLQRRCTV